MFNPLPAILIGGPPHAGKSVLTYSLTQALRKRHIEHYVIRACPDGEGDWSQEIDQNSVRLIRIKGDWTPDFVNLVCRDLERRHFPLLVDTGGSLQPWQTPILRHCTHSLLLLHSNDEATGQFWRQLVEEHGLLPLARLYSVLHGTSTITSESSIVEGTLGGLERNTVASGPLFDLLVERIAALFTSYSPADLRQRHLASAPAEAVDLGVFLQALVPQATQWEPGMIPQLLAQLPTNTPLAIYGRGPHWLYAALATRADTQPFYQFDSRLGWVTPPLLAIDETPISLIRVERYPYEHIDVLTAHPVHQYLDYTEAERLTFPSLPTGRGLIISGKLPFWLVTALVRLYNGMGTSWIACHYPPLHKIGADRAIIVVSHTPDYTPGDVITLPAP